MDQRGNLYGSSRDGRGIYLPIETGYSSDPISKTETSDCCTFISSSIKVPGLYFPKVHLIHSISYVTLMNRLHDYIKFRWAYCRIQFSPTLRTSSHSAHTSCWCMSRLSKPVCRTNPELYSSTSLIALITVSSGTRSLKPRIIALEL